MQESFFGFDVFFRINSFSATLLSSGSSDENASVLIGGTGSDMINMVSGGSHPVPGPSTLLLISAGLIGFVGVNRLARRTTQGKC
jgi:hypothetical protein